jgi:type IV secretory pathway VirB4 component
MVVDEAWLLMRDPAGARFLAWLAKAARKHWAGLTVVTQDAAELLATDLGHAVVANAATQILLRQAPQAIDRLAAAFRLSHGEQQLLPAADRGHGLLIADTDRIAFHVIAASARPTTRSRAARARWRPIWGVNRRGS